MRVAHRLEHTARRLYDDVGSARARRRYKHELGSVRRFCLFVGYPRSGHTVVGALLNAHRHAVVSHELNATRLILAGCTREELYSRILARAGWFHLRGDTSAYSYRVPNQWQGRFEALHVVGDKRGSAVTRAIAQYPDLLERVRSLVAVPIRLVHVVRDPLDNIAAISIWHRLSLEESVKFYFDHCRTTATLGARCDPSEVITVRHEAMIRDPRTVLCDLCSFLGLETYRGYVEDCSSIVFEAPRRTRSNVSWSPSLVREVERQGRSFPFLDGYEYEVREI